jgi:hypothetical protein
MIEKVVACSGPAVSVIQAVVVDQVTGPFSRSARHQRTCNHACKQAAQVLSLGSGPLNMAIPPEFLVKSAHIYGESFMLGGPRVCPKSELLSLHLPILGFLVISLNLCSKISLTLLRIVENLPDRRRFREHPLHWGHFKPLVENRPEIPEHQVVQNHVFTLDTVRRNDCSCIREYSASFMKMKRPQGSRKPFKSDRFSKSVTRRNSPPLDRRCALKGNRAGTSLAHVRLTGQAQYRG